MGVLHVARPPVVGQGEGVVVEHPLGLPRGAGGKVEKDGFGPAGLHPVHDRALRGHLFQKVLKAISAAQGKAQGDAGFLRSGQDSGLRLALPAGDDTADVCLLHPKGEVLLGEQVVGGGEDQTQPVGGQSHHPVTPVGAQRGHNDIALFQPPALKKIGGLDAQGFQGAEGQPFFLAPVVPPQHGQTVGTSFLQGVYDIVAVIVVVGIGVGPVGDLTGFIKGLLNKLGVECFHGAGASFRNQR